MKYFFWKTSWVVIIVLLVNQFFFIKESDSFFIVIYIILAIFILNKTYSHDEPDFLYKLEDFSKSCYFLTKWFGYALIAFVVLFFSHDNSLSFLN